ncbi:tRNA threonylcarbamoyladenosine biosynthesis protein TsaE [Lentibacillus sp. JNUCC-1]|uniref:tRNA (adenosine(37)-N6)-threonylcarbamoyltransferase complex ATPase subunit type 1 TsaE n=1 Tax=Lentibacillus sp. JNUCC-1 TaxID=2654513 RepID=UPI0012E9443C|nr:tRNA (adenosine(37)-N6)-threonylcarbamoyltransferase complex ATPase subunit type 1 TsaE [Lentibacillus sp. JNUCC-1]MUV38515.1 tRNA threonylcarbamoyladenosine biosynthesis protein TsaE [Lentibacillus sp. JNUCC-1]
MRKRVIKTEAETATKQLAEKLAMYLRPSDVITLTGELGTGKTTFTKGIANGLGVKRTVNSPTYTIVKEYAGELPLYHMDVYRLEDSEEDIGFEEYFSGDGICVVEWPQFIEPYLPAERLDVQMKHIDAYTRELTFIPRGQHFESVILSLMG